MNPEVAVLRRQSAQRKYNKALSYVRFLWTFAGLLLIALLIEVVIALCFSPRFWIYRMDVTGEESLTSAEVIRLTHLPAESNFYRTSVRELAKRISREPRVQRVAVRRQNIGVLGIEVTERQPACRLGWTTPLTYLDADGYLFTRPKPPTAPVVVVEGVNLPTPLRPGKRLTTDHVTELLACLTALRNTPADLPALDVTRLVISPRGGVTLKLRQGTRVYLGPPEDFERKIWVVRKTVIDAQSKGYSLDKLDYIDAKIIDRFASPDDNGNDKKTVLGAFFKPFDTGDGGGTPAP